MSNPLIVSFEDLQKVMSRSGGKLPSPARVRQMLLAHNIPYFDGMHGLPWTTVDALNYALNPDLVPRYYGVDRFERQQQIIEV